jgi:hypothetical protein
MRPHFSGHVFFLSIGITREDKDKCRHSKIEGNAAMPEINSGVVVLLENRSTKLPGNSVTLNRCSGIVCNTEKYAHEENGTIQRNIEKG